MYEDRWICNDPWMKDELTMDAINSYLPLKKQKISVYDKTWVSY
jgi:hypothetical protein